MSRTEPLKPIEAGLAPGGLTTLGQLCANLGPRLMDVVSAPRSVDVEVAGVLLHDPSDSIAQAQAAGALLLAVGVSPTDQSVKSLVRSAAAAGAIGVACRGGADWPQEVLEAAEASGISLVSVAAQTTWGELYELLSGAIAVAEPEPAMLDASGPEWRGVNDLSSIAEALAAVVGGPVAIEDMQSRVLAFSGDEESDPMRTVSILNRRVPEHWLREIRQRGIIKHLLSSEDVIHIDFDDLQPRRAIAIRLGNSVLGSIWLAGADETLSPDADEMLRSAAPVIALQMMRQRVAVNVERRMRESSLATLLHGGDSSARSLEQMGLPSDERLVVLVMEVVARTTSSPPAVGPRLIDLMTMHLHAYQRPVVATSLDDVAAIVATPEERIYVLTSCRDADDRAALRRIATECVNQATRTLGVECRAGIGHEVDPTGNLALARQSAEDCIVPDMASEAVVAFEDIYDHVLITNVEEFVRSWRGGTSAAYRALVAHDAAHGTEYLLTLRCVLDAFGSPSAAARRLHLHANTLRYRIKRIAEITGIDLGDGDARLALELTLRAGAPGDGTR